ncbi:MAG: hypothetical protein LBS05_07900 [Tannerellaceae bacterium]|jgi:hypothetical protein|nr:hypothetical protein [Tannerellaceae bacterium]
MQQPDFFAEFRPTFKKVVADQKAAPGTKFVLIHFPAPVEEIAQVLKVTKMMSTSPPKEEETQLLTFFYITFVIKMYDGIADRTQDPTLLHFRVTEYERDGALSILKAIINAPHNDSTYHNEWADAKILLHSFIKRIEQTIADPPSAAPF